VLKTSFLSFQVHKSEKQFECPACPLQFRHKNSLVRHLCQHTGERPYQCADCDAAFVSMHRLKEHSRKTHGHEFNIQDKVPKNDVVPTDAKHVVKIEPTSPKKKTKQTSNASPTLVQPVQKLPELCMNNTATVMPTTVLTSLPTSIPLLVQATNGQVYLLSTQNVGGSVLMPAGTAGLEILTPNQTLFFPTLAQQQQASFLAPTTGTFYQSPASQIEAESLLSSALQAAASASSIATSQGPILLNQGQTSIPTRNSNTSSSQRDSLVSRGVSTDSRRFPVMREGIRKADNGSTSLIGGLGNKKRLEFCGRGDIIKAALAENNIS